MQPPPCSDGSYMEPLAKDTVFLVFSYNKYGDSNFEGVYKTKEAASLFIEQAKTERDYANYKLTMLECPVHV